MRRYGSGVFSGFRCAGVLRLATTQSSSQRQQQQQQQQAREDEEDKELEEEEFRVMEEKDGDEYLPIAHRLSGKADALDLELQRIRWVLLNRRQFVVDTAGATLSGRPSRVDAVVHKVRSAYMDRMEGEKLKVAVKGDGGGDEPIFSNQDNHFASTQQPQQSSHAVSVGDLPLTASTLHPYAQWQGSSAMFIRLLGWIAQVPSMRPAAVSFISSPTMAAAGTSEYGQPTSGALTTLTADIEYLRTRRAMHALNYYSRMILIPKRHIIHSLYQVLWNAWIALTNACGSVIFGVLREVKNRGWLLGPPLGLVKGSGKALQFLCYGWVVSPLIHLPRGLANSIYGPLNALFGRYVFDSMSGRWMRCSVVDSQCFRHELQREKRLIRAVGRVEFKRKRMSVETKWANRLASMGFSMEMFQEKLKSKTRAGRDADGGAAQRQSARSNVEDPYTVLQVRCTATAQQIKAQYKKLAMVFHPDVVESTSSGTLSDSERAATQAKFASISEAYQILSNPEKRKAYDLGGSRAVHMHETKYGKFMSRTPEQMVQSIFGGESFRSTLTGELLRSHWSLRNEAQVSVSLHELEELQCVRMRQLSVGLAAIVDVHARKPTTPYHKHSAPAAAATQHRRVQMSGLPDPFGGRKPSGRAGTAGRSHGTAGGARGKHVLDTDMQSAVLEELGESKQGTKPQQRAGDTKTQAGMEKEDSAYKLHPGSNEYNCFSRDYEERCDAFISRMSDACFGPELLHEVGEAYIISAQRFLGVRPFYAPKMLVTRKVFTGIDLIYNAMVDKFKPAEQEELARKMMLEYISMEYDSVVADLHVTLRYATQIVLQDVVETVEVRKKRCYALWLLGEKMQAKGRKSKWRDGKRDDSDLIAYIQQAANSSATTSKPPAF